MHQLAAWGGSPRPVRAGCALLRGEWAFDRSSIRRRLAWATPPTPRTRLDDAKGSAPTTVIRSWHCCAFHVVSLVRGVGSVACRPNARSLDAGTIEGPALLGMEGAVQHDGQTTTFAPARRVGACANTGTPRRRRTPDGLRSGSCGSGASRGRDIRPRYAPHRVVGRASPRPEGVGRRCSATSG